MRTTVTLDDELANLLREQSRILDLPFKQVLNDAIRRGILVNKSNQQKKKFKVIPNKSGFVSSLDPYKFNQLVDELDVEDFNEESA